MDQLTRKADKLNQQKIDILTLNRLKIFNEKGEEIYFKSLWESRKVVIIFIRHFSCIACRAHVDMVWKRKDEIEKSKGKIIFVGNGKPYMIKAFKEDMAVLDAEIYTDPSLQTFDACGLKRNLSNMINLKTIKSFLDLKKQNHKQGPWDLDTGSQLQMGGVVALQSPGKVLYHYVSEYLGDFDNPEDWPDQEADVPTDRK